MNLSGEVLDELGKCIDVGNMAEVSGYYEFLAEKSVEGRLMKLLSLAVLFGSNRGRSDNGTVKRLLNQLQHCVRVFEAAWSDEGPSKSQNSSARRALSNEIEAIRSCTGNRDIEKSSMDFVAWEKEISESSNIEEVREAFLEIFSMWRLQLALNAKQAVDRKEHESSDDEDFRSSLNSLSQKVESSKAKLCELEERCHHWKDVAREREQQITTLEDDLRRLKADKGGTEGTKAKIQELKMLLEEREKEIDQLKVDHALELRKLHQQLTERERDSQRVAQLTARIENLQRVVSSDVLALQRENERLRSSHHERHEQVVPAASQDVVSLYDQFDDLDSEIANLSKFLKGHHS